MSVDVLIFRGVNLDDGFPIGPEQVLDVAHFGPARATVLQGNANVFPRLPVHPGLLPIAPVADHDFQLLPSDEQEEKPVHPIGGIRAHRAGCNPALLNFPWYSIDHVPSVRWALSI